MIHPDIQDCQYTVEVLRTRAATPEIANQIFATAIPPRAIDKIPTGGGTISLFHAFISASRVHHRSMRTRIDGGKEVLVPRKKLVGRKERFIYDVLIAQRGRHTVLAVPFHGLAEEFFPRVDRVLAGTRTAYERLDITRIVLALGSSGRVTVSESDEGSLEIGLTRCHLAYSDVANRSRDIQSVRIAGTNLGTTKEYRFLIAPVIEGPRSGPHVVPLVLGFSLYAAGVRKASAITDRHGNFKVFVGPGLRQFSRLFDLLEAMELMEDVVSTTPNLPILQSRALASELTE